MNQRLETKRLWLRLSTPDIYKEIFEQYNPEDAKKYLGLETDEAFEKEQDKFAGSLTTYRTSFVHFHLIEKTTERIIGDCCFHTWYFPHSRAEIGYSIWTEENKHKGFMKEAILPVIKYGFEIMDLNRIEAFISPENIPSQKLVRAMGFKEEGRLREHYRKNDIIEDSLVFGLLRKEFAL